MNVIIWFVESYWSVLMYFYRLLDSNHCDQQHYFTRPLSPGQSDDTIIFDCRFVPLIQEELDVLKEFIFKNKILTMSGS